MFNLTLRGGGVCWLRLRFPVPAGMHRKGLEHVGQLTVPRTSRVMVYSCPAASWLGAESGRSLQI
jgi:hypothetical protein